MTSSPYRSPVSSLGAAFSISFVIALPFLSVLPQIAIAEPVPLPPLSGETPEVLSFTDIETYDSLSTRIRDSFADGHCDLGTGTAEDGRGMPTQNGTTIELESTARGSDGAVGAASAGRNAALSTECTDDGDLEGDNEKEGDEISSRYAIVNANMDGELTYLSIANDHLMGLRLSVDFQQQYGEDGDRTHPSCGAMILGMDCSSCKACFTTTGQGGFEAVCLAEERGVDAVKDELEYYSPKSQAIVDNFSSGLCTDLTTLLFSADDEDIESSSASGTFITGKMGRFVVGAFLAAISFF